MTTRIYDFIYGMPLIYVDKKVYNKIASPINNILITIPFSRP